MYIHPIFFHNFERSISASGPIKYVSLVDNILFSASQKSRLRILVTYAHLLSNMYMYLSRLIDICAIYYQAILKIFTV